ncbi:MAG: hypothetical protein ACRC5M_01215 [Anaeroplasmataceae bacterium]
MLYVVFIISLLCISFNIALLVLYILHVKNKKIKRAENLIVLTGYASLVVSIVLFLCIAFGYSDYVVSLDYLSTLGSLFFIPLCAIYFIYDLKQINCIKELSVKEREKYGFSLNGRNFVVYLVILLFFIALILFFINLETFIYILDTNIG